MLAGVATKSEKTRKPSVPGPDLRPRKKRTDKRVFLDDALWDRLTDTAEFHSEVFKMMGADEAVSRNDIIEAFLEWADNAYWEDKGGRPAKGDKVGRADKARRHAEKLKSEQAKK